MGKNGRESWPSNADLNTADIASASEFMMYSILASKQSQTDYFVSDSQSCIDEVEANLRLQQKKELQYPKEDPLVID